METNYGGARKGAGRPVDIVSRLVLLEVARQEGVGESQAYRLIKKHGLPYLFSYKGGKKRLANLVKWGKGPRAQDFLERQEECFREEYPKDLEQRSLQAQINKIIAL